MTKQDAINKIARELGRIIGSKSLPKVFNQLEIEQGGYKISKSNHILQLLSETKTHDQLFIVLQKIFGLHLDMGKTIINEVQPALNKLAFEFKNGVIVNKKKTKNNKSFSNKIKNVNNKYSKLSNLISEAILKKGNKLSEAYLAIYLIENHLRLFVWKIVGKSNRKLAKRLNTKEKEKIKNRKYQEMLNKWIPLRRNSDLFYLDVDDLGSIIQRNWDMYTKYFPDQAWIVTKIQEITQIRNRIAHNNSNISETEKRTLELYMELIYNQIQ